jgi:superfamily I DNA/RNA helicase
VWSNAEEDVRAVVGYERLRRGEQVERRVAKLVCAWIVGHEFPDLELYTWDTLGLPEGKPDWMQGLTRLSASQREYIRDIRRHGEPLTKPGRVEISTVHGAKGGEADNVFLATDVNGRVAGIMLDNHYAEYRLAYVGATRAN